ncbi:MAG TPA: hypothetical protein VEN81_15005 [Planctomycetota bacterium]|nr:hypothetical protein [Planctomycetota bacterium]
MSRAFIRDPEPGEPLCPGCGTPGDEVGRPTLEAQLSLEARTPLGGSAFYCVNPDCSTAYFNLWGARVPAAVLGSGAYPKDPDRPICPCFGITAAEVEEDARQGRKDRIRDLMERAGGPGARCVERSPDGRPCLPRVLRLFRESFEGR